MKSISITEESAKNNDHACNCGAENQSGFPELDATLIPSAIRHSAIFDALEVTFLNEGPEKWHVQFVRQN